MAETSGIRLNSQGEKPQANWIKGTLGSDADARKKAMKAFGIQ